MLKRANILNKIQPCLKFAIKRSRNYKEKEDVKQSRIESRGQVV